MKKLLLAFSLLLIIGCKEKQKDLTGKENSKLALIDFTLSDLNDKTVSLKDFQGKTVLLVFWASWCPPCRGEIPSLNKIYEKYSNEEFSLLSVSLDNNLEKLKGFAADNNIKYTVLFDGDGKAANLYNVRYIPANFVMDKKGTLFSFDSDVSGAESKLEELLK